MSREKYVDYSTLKVFLLFAGLFTLIISLNYCLANLLFHLPTRIHWALTPVALLGIYLHFSLICSPRDTHDPYQHQVSGRGILLLPIIYYGELIQILIPRVAKQEWHKHRGLLVAGPLNLLMALGIMLVIHVPLSWPAILCAAFAVTAGYYSTSLLPIIWNKIADLWTTFLWVKPTP